jgi:heme-degrading monooxygenase HmoA
MISRIWHGWTTPENADAYEALLKREIFTGIQNRNIPGYRGIQLLRRQLTDEVEFVTEMWFDSLDAVRLFAGEDYEVAVVPAKARELLARFDARSQHYEVQANRRTKDPEPIRLGKSKLEHAQRFIEDHCRPLEAARLHVVFNNTPVETVIKELAGYQNPDGGFGRALEPDLRTPDSSALATSVAFQIMREIGAANNELAAPAIAYLLKTIDESRLRWSMIPESAENSPHAPWWNQSGLQESFGFFRLNPTAELLGYLYDYSELVPIKMIDALSDQILLRLKALDGIGMHDFLSAKRLAETKNLKSSYRQALLEQLFRLMDSVLVRDPDQWADYGLKPLQVAGSPGSPFYSALQELVPVNLDYEITRQNEDGSWPVSWSWGGLFPETWEIARMEWAGVITLRQLIDLKNYNRIEG